MRQPPSLDARTALRMTRPGFLVITPVACLLGFSVAHASGLPVSWFTACIVILSVTCLHAAANVLNDYHDARSGADEANTQGLFPFTGGARLIQNGEVTVEQTRWLAYVIAFATLPAGLWLIATSGLMMAVVIGLIGLCLGWAYSAPPLRLMTRGAGEITVGCVWALMVLGSDAVFRGDWSTGAMWAGLGYGAWIANILLINAFPDAPADAQVGKCTAVVKLGPRAAVWVYVGLWMFSLIALWVATSIHALPQEALWAWVSVPTGLAACVILWRRTHAAHTLRPAIVLTITTAVVYGLSLSLGCWISVA